MLLSYYFSVNVTSCFIAFDLLAPKSNWITWHSYLLNISVPDEGHSRNMHHAHSIRYPLFYYTFKTTGYFFATHNTL